MLKMLQCRLPHYLLPRSWTSRVVSHVCVTLLLRPQFVVIRRGVVQTLACLSRLQLLCVHPALVLAEESDKRRAASKNLHLSGKLMALRELLWDAGIGERYGLL